MYVIWFSNLVFNRSILDESLPRASSFATHSHRGLRWFWTAQWEQTKMLHPKQKYSSGLLRCSKQVSSLLSCWGGGGGGPVLCCCRLLCLCGLSGLGLVSACPLLALVPTLELAGSGSCGAFPPCSWLWTAWRRLDINVSTGKAFAHSRTGVFGPGFLTSPRSLGHLNWLAFALRTVCWMWSERHCLQNVCPQGRRRGSV